ncbi:MAG: hypothetical protein JJU28_14450 [Cyclobacteriaceae bacterium]|nr:hypothetical protein [Cyclobacteriaceae bacterium]
MQNITKHELQHILSGTGEVSFGATIQTISSYLGECTSASPKAENPKQNRQQEADKLEKRFYGTDFWISDIDFSQYISQGAEQRVFLKDDKTVFKLNNAIISGFSLQA